VQVLRGIPVNEFMGTMGIFSASLGMSCEDCHRSGDSSWANYATESPRKQMARAMVTMMATINKTHFGGRQVVTCFSCHRGADRPKATPNLATLYGAPPPEDPRGRHRAGAGGGPPPTRCSTSTWPPSAAPHVPPRSRASSPRGRAPATAPTANRGRWSSPPRRRISGPPSCARPTATAPRLRRAQRLDRRPAPSGGRAGARRRDLDGLRIDAELAFPSRIKQVAGQWRVGAASVIGDREVQVVQGTGSGGALVTLSFDADSGLLLRQVRYVASPVGRLPRRSITRTTARWPA
jgi:hypothetical protein